MNQAYYTMAEAAQFKGVSYHTVSRAVRAGRLTCQRIGRQALIARVDLVAWQPMYERRPSRYREAQAPNEAVQPTILGEVRA